MDAVRRGDLETIMAGLAAGDEAMLVALVDRFGGDLRKAVVAAAHRRGWAPGPDELDDLAFEVGEAVAAAARGWRADGGALPWVFAKARVEAIVGRRRAMAGHAPFDEAAHDRPLAEVAWVGAEADPLDVLAALGCADERCRLVEALLEELPSDRDRHVLLAYALQQDAGDPSPAVTVGAEVGMTEVAVRKVVSRGRARLRIAVRSDHRWAALAGAALLGVVAA